MTKALRETTKFIENSIDIMNEFVDYAKTDEKHLVDWKRHWALTSIEAQYRHALGALQITRFYLEEIEGDEYDALKGKLFNEWKKAEDRVLEEIK